MSNGRTIFAKELSDPVSETNTVSKQKANEVFQFFRDCPLFRWQDANNDCEDRANAACLLLQKWNIATVKAWVFSGSFLKKDEGNLTNRWNYHVAAALPVHEENSLLFYVIDPATLQTLSTAEQWAEGITETAYSYHLLKHANYYIFNPEAIVKKVWYEQNRQNYKWTMQGLAGINGVTKTGKAQLVFNKKKIQETEEAFKELLQHMPFAS